MNVYKPKAISIQANFPPQTNCSYQRVMENLLQSVNNSYFKYRCTKNANFSRHRTAHSVRNKYRSLCVKPAFIFQRDANIRRPYTSAKSNSSSFNNVDIYIPTTKLIPETSLNCMYYSPARTIRTPNLLTTKAYQGISDSITPKLVKPQTSSRLSLIHI